LGQSEKDALTQCDGFFTALCFRDELILDFLRAFLSAEACPQAKRRVSQWWLVFLFGYRQIK
jgi:hypothetical protein